MKIFSLIQIALCSAAGHFNQFNQFKRNSNVARVNSNSIESSLVTLNRAARYAEKIEHNDAALNRLMEDVSTFYELFLSGALTRNAVNAHLRQRDSHFIPLDQRQYDMLIDKWLYQMIGKCC